jgi:Zn-dependent peptidase ImmA (M78 family)/transcriptional regulator with XRE-family HTH domain
VFCKPESEVNEVTIGERLKMARTMNGFSQRELASRAGVTATAISKYERGAMVPSSGVLLKLSSALGVRVEYLMRPDTYPIHLTVPAFRSAHMNEKEEGIVKEKTREWLERYLEVEDLFDLEQQDRSSIPLGYPIRVSDIREVEQVAVKLRQEWGLGNHPIESLTDLLEEKGIKVGAISAPASFDALAFWYDDTTPVIIIREGVPGDRQRFSIAHELGHLMVEPSQDLDKERVAHRFAGAFLVPEEVARAELGASRQRLDLFELHLLKHQYGMSIQAWVHRAKDLGIIPEREYHRIFDHFDTMGWRSCEPGDQIPPEEPRRMKRLIMRAYAEDVISASRASELLGKSIPDFCQTEEERHGGFPIEMCD